MRASRVPAPSKSAISEAELDRLLDAVRSAIEVTPQDFLSMPIFDQPSEHTNSNVLAWPLLPVPEGWYGA